VDMRRALPDELISALSEFRRPRGRACTFRKRAGAIWKAGLPLPPATSASRMRNRAPAAPVHTPGTQPYRNPRQPPDGRETYFYREQRSLEVLEAQILPELLRSRRDDGRPFESGAQPAAPARNPTPLPCSRPMMPDPKACPVTMLATDINPQFLRKAAEGVYGEWSFRARRDG